MPKYLQVAEVNDYCEFFSSEVTGITIDFAELLVDTYLGESLEEQTETEEIKLTRKNTGQLSRCPVSSIVSVVGEYITASGLMEGALDKTNIKFKKNGYFEYLNFVTPLSINNYLGYQLYCLKIEYKHGYATIPQKLKRAVAMLCQNLIEKKSFSGIKSISNLDVNISMFDDSLLTKDIKQVLDGLKNGAA